MLWLWLACNSLPEGVSIEEIDDSHQEVIKKYPSGALSLKGQLKKGTPMGLWEEWYEEGPLKARYSFLDGLEHGERTVWYPTGQIAEQGAMQFGHQEGEWQMWHENGQQRAKTYYKKGIETGQRSIFYESGQAKSQAMIEGGMQSGLRIFWYENGQMQKQGYFALDMLNGPQEEWSTEGRWIRTVCYEQDQAKSEWYATEPSLSDKVENSQQQSQAPVFTKDMCDTVE